MNALLDALRSLPPIGEDGFEGFVRDVLAHVTGQKFRLVKPGPQGGIDTLSESSDRDSVSIGVEAKRFGKTNRLPLDKLKWKLTDAANTHPDLDLWVLAASQEMCAADQKKLREIGDRLGVAVLILDWSSSPDALPALAVLAASARRTIEAHIEVSPSIAAELTNLENDERFEPERQRLITQLTAPDLGYATTLRHVAKWLRLSFRDPATARARLDTFANLHDPAVQLVPRMALEATLSEWWLQSSDAPIALLGDEGAGKTWTILSWWDQTAGEEGDGLPLTLVVPARRVNSNDCLELIAEELWRQTEEHTSKFWRTRLDRWLRRPGHGSAQILLVLDGLNQSLTYSDWVSLLERLFDEKIRGRVALAMTCRPDHWRAKLKSLQNLLPRARELTIGPFDDEELDELLSMHGLSKCEFQQETLKLLKVPVLCQRAIQLRKELEGSGDVTPERLVFEDWRQRLAQHGERIAIDEVEFAGYLTSLGRDLHTQIKQDQPEETVCVSRSEIIKELGRESGKDGEDLATTISEIVDGRWMEQTDHPHRFKLRPQRAPFVLGLALVDHLRSHGEKEGLVEQLAAFLDPLRGRDFGVDILRAASTVALLQPRCPRSIRRTLIEAWLSSQNFRQTDFDSFWRLIGINAELWLEITENAWLRHRGGIDADEVFIRGLSKAAKYPEVASSLQQWADRWLGRYWNDPLEGRVSGYDPSSPGAERRRKATIERREDWDRDLEGKWTGVAISIERIEDGIGAGWLVKRVVGVLSFLPRLPFVNGLTAWAVTRAIMGSLTDPQAVRWLLRLNPHDASETEDALIAVADQFISLEHPLADAAAWFLLDALATRRASARLSRLPDRPKRTWGPTSRVLMDGKTGEIKWDHEAALELPASKEDVLFAVSDLAGAALDPNSVLGSDNHGVLRTLAGRANAVSVHEHIGQTMSDVNMKGARYSLARWAPEALADLVRSRFDSAPELAAQGFSHLVHEIPQNLILLSHKQRGLLAERFRTLEAELTPTQSDQVRLLRRRSLLVQLHGLSARAQIDLIRQIGADSIVAELHQVVLARPREEDYSVLSGQLDPDSPTEELCGWLNYLSLVRLDELPPAYEPLGALLLHPDSLVRGSAMKVIYHSGDKLLLSKVSGSQWTCSGKMIRHEAIYGSLALCQAVNEGVASCADVRTRLHQEALGVLASDPSAEDEDLSAFEEFVHDSFLAVLREKAHALNRTPWFRSRSAIDSLIQRRGDNVLKWFAPVLEGRAESLWYYAFLDEFPVVSLCRALLRHRPEDGALIWSALMRSYEHGSVRMEGFERLPIAAPDSPAILDLRLEVLRRATTDQDLSKVSSAAHAFRQEAWLLRTIKRGLKEESPAGKPAQAVTLAGFLGFSQDSDKLWNEDLAEPPAKGWLAEVTEWARPGHERSRWAHHWFDLFLMAESADCAFAYHVLFAECADARAVAWADQRIRELEDTLPSAQAVHWWLSRSTLPGRGRNQGEGSKDRLFGDRIMRTQAPWL